MTDLIVLPKNQILLGACEELLKTLPDCCIDAIVTDPPYGLGTHEPTAAEIMRYLAGEALNTGGDFMGKAWEIPSVPVWKECLRVLKPGGYILSFGGTRTWDIMSMGLRAAGFDNRDTISSLFSSPCLQWIHGQGFPKSLNVSKAIDKISAKPAIREDRLKLAKHIRDCRKTAKLKPVAVAAWFPENPEVTKNWERVDLKGNRVPTLGDYEILIEKMGCSPEYRDIVRQETERHVVGHSDNGLAPGWVAQGEAGYKPEFDITTSTTDQAKQWEGYGTALKPAWEPILCFRKPLAEATVAEQILATGTGAINIDETRVKHSSPEDFEKHKAQVDRIKEKGGQWAGSWKNSSDLSGASEVTTAGRWPSNVIMTHLPECKVVETMEVEGYAINRFTDGMKPFGDGAGHPYESVRTSAEQLPVYECAEGCPVASLDGQVPEANPAKYFTQFTPEAPFFYTGKASKREKNEGVLKGVYTEGFMTLRSDFTDEECLEFEEAMKAWPDGYPDPRSLDMTDVDKDGERVKGGHLPVPVEAIPEEMKKFFLDSKLDDNNHPTVKPVALMKWLVRMVTPEGGIVLDPYAGSGTTCAAAAESNRIYVGFDRDKMYHALANKRVGLLLDRAEDRRHVDSLFSMAESLPQGA